MKNATFQTILEDLKISIKFAYKNAISYLLALFGVIIVSIILLVLVAIIIFVPLFFALNGMEGFIEYFMSFDPISATGMMNIAVGAILVMIPLVSPFFVAIGALFGLGREIVESEGTSAQGVFTWYKKRFFSLAGGGIILFLFAFGPILLILLAGAAIYGESFINFVIISSLVTDPLSSFLGGLLVIWFAISLGLLSMLFPAIIDGYSVIEATKKSIGMSIKYFDRVFGVWISYLVLLGALVLPMVAIPFVVPYSLALTIILGIYAVPATLFLIFFFLPALTIGLTRVYMILTADDEDLESSVDEEETSSPSFIGGM